MLTQTEILQFFKRNGFFQSPARYNAHITFVKHGIPGDNLCVVAYPEGKTEAFFVKFRPSHDPDMSEYLGYWRLDPAPNEERLEQILGEMLEFLPVPEGKK